MPAEWGRYQPLVDKLLKQCSLDSLTKLKDLSGRSGAETFLVQPGWTKSALDPAILKVGPKVIVDHDVDGLEQARFLYPGANYFLCEATDDELRALLLKLAGGTNCDTFEDFYLNGKTTPEQIEHCINTLFGTAMRTSTLTPFSGTNPFAQYNFRDPDAQSRALRSIGDGLPTMIRWWERARDNHFALSTRTAVCHGDLHRKNILVCGRDVYVVDFGLLERKHAMRDFAKLERDILLFLYPADLRQSEPLGPLPFEPDFRDGDLSSEDRPLQKCLAAVRSIRAASRALIADDSWLLQYRVAMLAQMMFAASDEGLDETIRKRALHYASGIREALERTLPNLAVPPDEHENAHRRDLLWKFAYAFLRLDQLDSGGWGKSLPAWFEALVERDNNTIGRSPDMRITGGTDLTVYGYVEHLRFQTRLGSGPLDAESFQTVGAEAWKNLRSRIGWDGGVGTGRHGRANAPVSVRHTILGLVGFLYYYRHAGINPAEEIKLTSTYLNTHLQDWAEDKSHLFSCYCGLAKLREMLTLCAGTLDCELAELSPKVDTVLPRMAARLNEAQPEYKLKPVGTCRLPSANFPYRPYADFWRMERSNLLMHLPFLLTENEDDFHAFIEPKVRDRCIEMLGRITNDCKAVNEARHRLCFYYRDGSVDELYHGPNRPQDWGLTAELVALLRTGAIKKWLPGAAREAQSLAASLVATYDQYHQRPDLFKFTHGTSFARCLLFADADMINVSAVKRIDAYVEKTIKAGCTESDLNELCNKLVRDERSGPREAGLQDVAPLRDLLVDKLEAGEHIGTVSNWQTREQEGKKSTIRFFDGPGGLDFATHYGDEKNVIDTLVTRLMDVVPWPVGAGRRSAIDVGCGPGQYAELLVAKGFDVELFDASVQMLETAQQRLNISTPPRPRDLSDLANPDLYRDEVFDLVFACAIMVHVPKREALGVLKSFYRILRPGAALFVNFKIGDHTLLGIGKSFGRDERYFEYYRDHSIAWNMLEEVGFEIHEISLRWNRKTMYRDPKRIHWANFYCTKKVPGP